jgi:hypothetical protein
MKALRYNSSKLKWSLVDFGSLGELVKVLEYGAHKYSVYRHINSGETVKGVDIPMDDPEFVDGGYEVITSGAHNWKLGLDNKEILESAMRHLTALMDGQDLDPESKRHHMGHIMCNAMFYMYQIKKEAEKNG